MIQNHLGPISCTPLTGTVLGVKKEFETPINGDPDVF